MVSAMEGTWPEENVHAGAAPLPPPSPIRSCRNRSPRKMDLGSAFRDKSIPFCAFCESKQAAFFCDADEAYLCHACDSSVHSANSLASKHKRIPVFESSVKFEDSVLNFEESVATLEESGSSARSEELGNSGSEAPSDEKFWSNLWTPTTCGLRIGGITYAKVTKVKVESESLIDHIDMQRFESNPGNLSKLRMSGNEISHEGARFVPVAQELPFFGAQEDGTMFPPFDFPPAWEEGAKKSCSTEYLVPEGGSADQFMDFGPEMFDLDVWNGGAKREIERGNEFFDVWKENGELGAKKYVQDLESGRNPMRRMLLKGRLGKNFQSGEPDSRAEDECARSYSDDEDHHVGSSEKDLQEKRVGQIHAAEVLVLNSEENKEEIERNRRARVMRYREKRHTRLFSKKIRYEVRKINAERRPRIKGRFVKS